MKVLVTGVKGQLGYDVVKECENGELRPLAWMWKRWTLPMPLPVSG